MPCCPIASVTEDNYPGIELRNGFVPAGTLFGSKLPAHDFDLAMFTQLVTVDPHYVVSNFTCGNAANYTEY